MLEANTFRSMMLVCGVVVLAILVACFFTAPLVPISSSEKTMYENVTNHTLDAGTTHLTGYEAVLFSLQGRSRGNVQHY